MTDKPKYTPGPRFKYGKFGLLENPLGCYVALPWKGRTLLGEVREAAYNPVLGAIILTVRHFNGEAWPVQPTALSVEVIR